MTVSNRVRLRLELLEQRTQPAVFYVTNLNDGPVTRAGDLPGSLRQAIFDANAGSTPVQDRIEFRGLAPGRALFFPRTPLPAITQPVLIAGDTQAGYDGTKPLVEISGLHAGPNADGLRVINTNQTIIRGLVIDAFSGSGVYLENANNVTVQGCYIGTDYSGETHSANLLSGIFVRNSSGNRFGTNQDGINDLVEGNVISGNLLDGITLVGSRSGGNTIIGNRIGTNPAGTRANANGGHGVYIGPGAASNSIGTADTAVLPGVANVISGNRRSGVFMEGADTTLNSVRGALIGVDASGTYAVANGEDGVTIGNGAVGNTIGIDPDEVGAYGTGNVISGNRLSGVSIFGTTTGGNQVSGNLIGTSRAGTTFVPNGDAGVTIWGGAGGNLIGTNGDARHDAVERNVISGNRKSGILIRDFLTSGNGVYGNYVGTSSDGLSVVANGGDGITVAGRASGTVIGDFRHTKPVLANLIAGNILSGVRIGVNGDSDGNVVAGNRIGTNANLAPLPNGWAGITVLGNSRTNRLSRNSIYANHGLGIDLNGDGVTANDIGVAPSGDSDLDGGANLSLNFPDITSASATSASSPVTVQGVYHGTRNSSLTIELYSSPVPDPSGYGEGLAFVGVLSGTTSAAGVWNFTATFGTLRADDYVTALAIDQFGNTSEFSLAVRAVVIGMSSQSLVASFAPGNPILVGEPQKVTSSPSTLAIREVVSELQSSLSSPMTTQRGTPPSTEVGWLLPPPRQRPLLQFLVLEPDPDSP